MTDKPEADTKAELREPPRMTVDEINDMARDLVANKVFVATMAPPDMLSSIFMPLMLDGTNWDWSKVGNVVERMDKANPRGVNGYPTFFSCRLVHVDDWGVIGAKALAIQEAIDATLAGGES